MAEMAAFESTAVFPLLRDLVRVFRKWPYVGCFSGASAKGMNHGARSLLRPFHLAVVDVAELSELMLSVIVSFWNLLSLVG